MQHTVRKKKVRILSGSEGPGKEAPVVQVKDLSVPTIDHLLREVKWEDEESCESCLREQTRRPAKRLLEGATEEELVESLCAGRYRRIELRRRCRNGACRPMSSSPFAARCGSAPQRQAERQAAGRGKRDSAGGLSPRPVEQRQPSFASLNSYPLRDSSRMIQ